MSKKWYYSKTIWANILVGIISVAGILPTEWQQGILPVVAVLNIILRSITKEGITK